MKQNKDRDKQTPSIPAEQKRAPPVVTVDYEKYERFLEDSDLSEDQRIQFLQALWTVICQFVSLGFGVHPVQQAQNICVKLKESPSKSAPAGPNGVKYEDRFLITNFEDASDLEVDAAAEGVET